MVRLLHPAQHQQQQRQQSAGVITEARTMMDGRTDNGCAALCSDLMRPVYAGSYATRSSQPVATTFGNHRLGVTFSYYPTFRSFGLTDTKFLVHLAGG